MKEINIKIETEKKLFVPELSVKEYIDDVHCIIDDENISMNCSGFPCQECICYIDNFKLLSDSQKIQTL